MLGIDEGESGVGAVVGNAVGAGLKAAEGSGRGIVPGEIVGSGRGISFGGGATGFGGPFSIGWPPSSQAFMPPSSTFSRVYPNLSCRRVAAPALEFSSGQVQ